MPRHRTVAALAALAAALPAVAQDSGGIEEVVVSVQKRAQSLADVPVSVSAFSPVQLDELNLRDLDDLVELTPGFAGATDDSFTDALAIRGISTNDFGLGGDPSVAIFVNGVHEGRNGGAVTTFLDVGRVEVVRGPQNTLFGRNAIAGAIAVTTNRPENETGGALSLIAEQFGHAEAEGTINVPLTDRLYFRGTGYFLTEDGYVDNLAGGKDVGEFRSRAFQAALRYAGDRVDTTLTLFHEDREGDPSAYWSTAPLGSDLGFDPAGTPLPKGAIASDTLTAGRGTDDPRVFRASLDVTATLGDYSLNSITGYKTYDFRYREDYDATGRFINDYEQDQEVDYWSQEFRITSPDAGRLTWFAGVSAYVEDVKASFRNRYAEDELCRALARTEVDPADTDDGNVVFPASTAVTGCDDPAFELEWGEDLDPGDIDNDKSELNVNEGTYRGWAVFADATLAITERLDLTVGARYTWDEKEFSVDVADSGGALGNNLVWSVFTDGPVSDTQDWSGFTPRAALNFRATEAVTLFASVSTGFKSGGFATFGLDIPGNDPDNPVTGLVPDGTRPSAFDEEEVLSLEAGLRLRLLGNRLQANVTVYDYTYDDLQLTFFTSGQQLTDNVAEASGRGVEVDARYRPTANWDILVAASYMDTEIDKVDADFLALGGCDDCAGNELPFAPEWSGTAVVTYKWPFAGGSEAFFTTQYHYQAETFGGADNLALSTVPSWDEFAFRLGYDSGAEWRVTAYVENAFDEEYFERGWENADADNLGGYGLVNTLVWPSKPRTFGLRADWQF
jgi:iron complex outermembrane receptor protein